MTRTGQNIHISAARAVKRYGAYAACVLLYAAEWCLFREQIFTDHPSLVVTFIKALPDAALLFILYWAVPEKWRKAALVVPLWIVSIFFLVNLVYKRFFHTLLPLSSLFFFENFNGLVFKGALVNFRAADTLFLLLPAIFTAGVYLLPFKTAVTKRERWVMAVLSLTLFAGAQMLYVRALSKEWEDNGLKRSTSMLLRVKYVEPGDDFTNLTLNGVPVYMIKCICTELSTPRAIKQLDDDNRAQIDRYFQTRTSLLAEPDSATVTARRENLIFIIVESLNAEIIGATVNGLELTPTLNSMIKAEGTISALNVLAQISDGGSSDGQMLYNTGLLPVSKGATAMLYDKNTYPSLAKSLEGYYSVEVIGEEAHYWNHSTTSQLYRFNHLYSIDDIKTAGFNPEADGSDGSIFGFASKILPSLKQPFYMEITTISMHTPFRDSGVKTPAELEKSALPLAYRNYYAMAHYFDSKLGDFIETLKQQGLYDNSLIVIASDHNCPLSEDEYETGTDGKPSEIVFMALNTGITRQIDRQVGQVDIFPTVLEIMGASPAQGKWSGLGLSILNDNCNGAVDRHGNIHGSPSAAHAEFLKSAWTVSDLLIRSNYFNNN